jgi:hypothetical protein
VAGAAPSAGAAPAAGAVAFAVPLPPAVPLPEQNFFLEALYELFFGVWYGFFDFHGLE